MAGRFNYEEGEISKITFIFENAMYSLQFKGVRQKAGHVDLVSQSFPLGDNSETLDKVLNRLKNRDHFTLAGKRDGFIGWETATVITMELFPQIWSEINAQSKGEVSEFQASSVCKQDLKPISSQRRKNRS